LKNEEWLILLGFLLASTKRGIIRIQSVFDLVILFHPFFNYLCCLVFCVLEAFFPAMQILCNFGVGERELCFKFLKKKKKDFF